MFDLALSQEAMFLIPLVIALVEIIKQLGVPSRFAPLVSIALGVGGAFLLPGALETVQMTVLSGLVIALTASGLYSGSKAVVTR